MRNTFFKLVVLSFLIISAWSCEQCSECANDLSGRFRFVDSARTEIFTNPSLVSIVDFDANNYPISREANETDTFYVADFRPLTTELESPDTVLLFYNNTLIDSLEVGYTFSSDSRCCNNTLTVGSFEFFNRDAARRIRPLFPIYDIIIN